MILDHRLTLNVPFWGAKRPSVTRGMLWFCTRKMRQVSGLPMEMELWMIVTMARLMGRLPTF
ncbi:hypothetical protein SAMCCGM7_pA0022 (plasmid) [Sinorhizobium americanum CCGM7]|nr:hypothetical protein SAMCCGM7_pA0022 [Sinorhizobium americanum CCGM7]